MARLARISCSALSSNVVAHFHLAILIRLFVRHYPRWLVVGCSVAVVQHMA